MGVMKSAMQQGIEDGRNTSTSVSIIETPLIAPLYYQPNAQYCAC